MGTQTNIDAIDRFKKTVQGYGIEKTTLDKILESIRILYLTGGQMAPEIHDLEKNILNQLGIGWPHLTPQGTQIAKELIDNQINIRENAFYKIVNKYPPRVISLFIQAADKGLDIFSWRIPEQPQSPENKYYGSLNDLINHPKIQPLVITLITELKDEGLAIEYSAPAYRGAKWWAKFIYVPARVVEKINKHYSSMKISFDACIAFLNDKMILDKNIIDTLQELEIQGMSKKKLENYLRDSINVNDVTPFSESGPAYLILNREGYDKHVILPIISKIVEELLKQNNFQQISKKEIKEPSQPPKIISQPFEGKDIIIGTDKSPAQWGVIGKTDDSLLVKLDLNAPHIMFVCGKMGSGKGYSIGVVSEMLMAKSIGKISNVKKRATIIVFYNPEEDMKSEFWSIRYENDFKEEILKLQNGYNITPQQLLSKGDFRIFIDPFIYENGLESFKIDYSTEYIYPIYIEPSTLSGKEWAIVLSTGGKTDQLYVKRLFSIIEKHQFEPFDLNNIKDDIISDKSLTESQKKLADLRLENLRNYLVGENEKHFLDNLAIGGVNIVDFRKIIRTPDDIFSVMTLILSVLQTRKGLEDETFVFVLNEAHAYFKGNVSEDFVNSIEYLIRKKRHGGNWLMLDTHFPDELDDKVIKMADIKVIHFLDKTVSSNNLKRVFGDKAKEFSNLNIGQAFISADQSSLGKFKPIMVNIRPRLTKHGAATKTTIKDEL